MLKNIDVSQRHTNESEEAVAVNPTTNKVYVVNQDGNTVTVLTASGGKGQ